MSIMFNSDFHKDNYDSRYLAARAQMDELCDSIVTGMTDCEKAIGNYARIESEFAAAFPENAELFRMIYKNRVERLCSQFLSGGS